MDLLELGPVQRKVCRIRSVSVTEAPTLAFQRRGEGPLRVVLIHGFLGSGHNLGALARAWHQRDPGVGLILPDLRGHGRSPPLFSGANLFTLAEDLITLLETVPATTPLRLVGHSLGGRVALCARSLAPDRFDRVDLLDISPSTYAERHDTGLEPVLRALAAAPAKADSRETFRAHFLSTGISASLTEWLLTNLRTENGGNVSWRFDRELLLQLHDASRKSDLWHTIDDGAPLVCTRGEHSRFVTPSDRTRFHALGIPVHTVKDTGHFLHVEKTQPLLRILTQA